MYFCVVALTDDAMGLFFFFFGLSPCWCHLASSGKSPLLHSAHKLFSLFDDDMIKFPWELIRSAWYKKPRKTRVNISIRMFLLLLLLWKDSGDEQEEVTDQFQIRLIRWATASKCNINILYQPPLHRHSLYFQPPLRQCWWSCSWLEVVPTKRDPTSPALAEVRLCPWFFCCVTLIMLVLRAHFL